MGKQGRHQLAEGKKGVGIWIFIVQGRQGPLEHHELALRANMNGLVSKALAFISTHTAVPKPPNVQTHMAKLCQELSTCISHKKPI